MGFTEETQAYLINNVQIVLHAAADVRFDQTLKKAIEVNVRGTRDLLRLTKNIKNIEVTCGSRSRRPKRVQTYANVFIFVDSFNRGDSL
jgi:dTDP-D-glucose 4,6-dehydratase